MFECREHVLYITPLFWKFNQSSSRHFNFVMLLSHIFCTTVRFSYDTKCVYTLQTVNLSLLKLSLLKIIIWHNYCNFMWPQKWPLSPVNTWKSPINERFINLMFCCFNSVPVILSTSVLNHWLQWPSGSCDVDSLWHSWIQINSVTFPQHSVWPSLCFTWTVTGDDFITRPEQCKT